MVERWTLPFDFGGSEMTPAPGGEFVSYADYEADERKIAELEAERDDLAQRAAVIDEALTNAVQLRTAAEADKARLSEALRAIVARSHNDPLGTSKVNDMRNIATAALSDEVTP